MQVKLLCLVVFMLVAALIGTGNQHQTSKTSAKRPKKFSVIDLVALKKCANREYMMMCQKLLEKIEHALNDSKKSADPKY